MSDTQQDNPYSGMLGLFRKDTSEHSPPYPWRFGVVRGVKPLKVEMDGLMLEGKDILVNIQTIEHRETVVLTEMEGVLHGKIDCQICREDHGCAECEMKKMEITGGEIKASALLGGVLEPGDTVVLLESADSQQYVVLCKVVEA